MAKSKKQIRQEKKILSAARTAVKGIVAGGGMVSKMSVRAFYFFSDGGRYAIRVNAERVE